MNNAKTVDCATPEVSAMRIAVEKYFNICYDLNANRMKQMVYLLKNTDGEYEIVIGPKNLISGKYEGWDKLLANWSTEEARDIEELYTYAGPQHSPRILS